MKTFDISSISRHLDLVSAFGVRRLRPMNSICKIRPAACPRFSSRESYARRGTSRTMITKCYYVYELRVEGIPFYVGKGRGRRIKDHRWAAGRGEDLRVYRKIRKIWREGLDYEEVKVAEGLTNEEAILLEISLIAKYGRKSLCNLTDGGEGRPGGSPSKETRAKLSTAGKGRVVLPETRAKISMSNIKRYEDPKQREKMAEIMRKRFLDPEARAKVSAFHKGRTATPETRAKMSKARKGKPMPPGTFDKRSAALKGRVVSPETRAKISAAGKGRVRTLETRARMSASAKNMHPDTRAKITKARQKL